ncbi:MFS transporter [Acuticoccus sediminis]|uniref:MFS transporter n=1 Tax=Acuticoccus sediminis TaxID=2184697 RepID=UPI001CFC8F26|nr:MFS transporter [Acuticoccus sediminis]
MNASAAPPIAATPPRARHPYAAVGAALAGCFLASYHTRFLGVGLPDLSGAFALSADEASWLATVANAPQILTAPAVPWLVLVFGIRPVLMWPGLIYAALVALIPLVREPVTLFALHGAAALLLGLFVPATLLIIVKTLPPPLWLIGFGAYAFRLAFTLNSGPGLVGWFTATIGWEWLYWADVPLALVMSGLAFLGSRPAPADQVMLRHADWGGMALFGVALFLLYAGLDQGNRLDWAGSGTVVSAIAGGAALFVIFVVHELRAPTPWAAPGILASRNTVLGFGTGILFSAVAVSNSVLVPNFLVGVGGLRPEQFGVFLFAFVAVPLAATITLGVVLLRRFDFRLVMMLGFAHFAAASLWATGLTSAWRIDDFIPVVLLQSVGLGITFTAVMIGNFTSVRPEAAAAFAAYIQILRLIAVEFGAALMLTLLRIREGIHSALIGLHVTAGSADAARRLAAEATLFEGGSAMEIKAHALGSLAHAVREEATTLAFIDGFSVTFVLALLGILFAGAMGAAPPGPLTPRPRGG